MNVLTVNYNTKTLTNAFIRSVRKHTDCKVYVFDNSDREPFTTDEDVEVIDNTGGQFVDWDLWLDSFPDKYPNPSNGYGSAKHCKSVQVCMGLIADGFILADPDILVKRDLSDLWDEEYVWVGEISYDEGHFISVPRLLPYLCYINVPLCHRLGIGYFNGEYMWKLTRRNPNRFYDTGAWFLESSLQYPHKEIAINGYMTHLGSGSWKNDGKRWLDANKSLWA